MPCIPCQGTTKFASCKFNKCMDIDPGLVLDVANKLLSGNTIVVEEQPENAVKPKAPDKMSPDEKEITVNKNYMEF